VELGGIEPPSVKGQPAAIRPFPVRSVVATSRLSPLMPKHLPSVFPWGQRSFSPSAVFPCCPSLHRSAPYLGVETSQPRGFGSHVCV